MSISELNKLVNYIKQFKTFKVVYNKYDELKGKQSILIELINRKEVSDMSDKLTLKELTEIVIKGFAEQREFNARQEEFNVAILKRLDQHDERFNKIESILMRHDEIFKKNNLH
ncbi:MAG: hypothetical protein ACRC4M_05845 [Mycoplasma sp.]